jgi:uncharacterized membrane protein
MSRTNIDVDDEACEAVMRLYHLETKREAVNFALRQRESPADLALSQALNDPSVDVMVPEPVQAEVLIHARIDAPMLHHDRDFVPLLDIAGVTVAPGSLGA